MPATLSFFRDPKTLGDVDTLLFVGRKARLLSDEVQALLPASVPAKAWEDMVRRNEPGDHGRTAVTYTGQSWPKKVAAGILPEVCSRHNSPSRAWAIPKVIGGAGLKGDVGIVLCLDEPRHAAASALAAARVHSTYAATSRRIERHVRVAAVGADLRPFEHAARAVRAAAHLVDSPPNELNTESFVQRAEELARDVRAEVTVIRGEELLEHNLGGIHAVGKAARQKPAMVVLDHRPAGARTQTAWVGKGIVYDTGGLSLKTKTSMPTMKTDMGGAAAVMAAFGAAVRMGYAERLTAVLCIAENAVGPDATRPDDVITMYSGKTVEVNNTDAEGRLVLADGTAWVTRNRSPELLVDLATLTGAQATSTGKQHAALYCTDEELERRAVVAGRHSGDLCHPLPYCPEFFRKEFASQVADMRNSVKDRANAQSSCAGQFIGNHITDFEGDWLHIDMAGPSTSGGRATGWGVGLLLTLAGLL